MASEYWRRQTKIWRHGRLLTLVLGVPLAFLLLISMEWEFDLGETPPLRFAYGLLLPFLVNERELPAIPTTSEDGGSTLIYVLGGSQESLRWRIPLAATLYHRMSGSRVIFMNVREITGYNPGLGRNYTHDEWVTHEMMEVKVPATDIEFIAMPAGNFGTLSEARYIADLVKRRRYGRLILVTSAYHTRRVLIAFSRFLNGQGELYIYGSDEKVRFGHLMAECIKILFYRYILIPISGGWF